MLIPNKRNFSISRSFNIKSEFPSDFFFPANEFYSMNNLRIILYLGKKKKKKEKEGTNTYLKYDCKNLGNLLYAITMNTL